MRGRKSTKSPLWHYFPSGTVFEHPSLEGCSCVRCASQDEFGNSIRKGNVPCKTQVYKAFETCAGSRFVPFRPNGAGRYPHSFRVRQEKSLTESSPKPQPRGGAGKRKPYEGGCLQCWRYDGAPLPETWVVSSESGLEQFRREPCSASRVFISSQALRTLVDATWEMSSNAMLVMQRP